MPCCLGLPTVTGAKQFTNTTLTRIDAVRLSCSSCGSPLHFGSQIMTTTSEDDLRAFFLLFKKLSADPSILEQGDIFKIPYQAEHREDSSFHASVSCPFEEHEEANESPDFTQERAWSTFARCVSASKLPPHPLVVLC